MPGFHCSVRDCHNGILGLKKWKEEFCPLHDCNKGTSRCICEPPYVLYPFPTERKNPERRVEWIQLMNRKNILTGKNWVPTRNSRVCSLHFVDGAPSISFPNPTVNLGYSVPSTCKRRKRAPPKPRAAVAGQSPKKMKLSLQSPSTEDTRDQGPGIEDTQDPGPSTEYTQTAVPSKEDGLKTGKSDSGLEVMSMQAHVDHTYIETDTCNCQSPCNCEITRLRDKICQLESRLKMVEIKSDKSYSDISLSDMMNIKLSANAKNKRYLTERFISDDKSVKQNTGLPNKATFNKLLQVLTPRAAKMRYWGGTQKVISTKRRKFRQTPLKSGPGRKLSIKEEFLMVLMRLRLGLTSAFLASIFSISAASCSTIITTWIKFLGVELRGLVFWPDKNSICTMLPAGIAEKYPNLRCILDCSETFIDRPRDLKLQAATWSDYKKHNTLKYLVCIAPNGHISFMSKAWGGRTTDRQVVQQSGFLDLVDPHDLIMADRGFPIHEDLLFKMAKLVIPPPSSGLEQMCSQNVSKTRKVANVRIHVERAINRLKWFHILSSTLPLTMAHLFNDILIICAALCNLLPPLVV